MGTVVKQHKYKAWNKADKQWIDGFMDVPLMAGLEYTINGGNIVIVEFTGRRDSKGEEIYEDSIIKDQHGIGWVFYDPAKAAWCIQRYRNWSFLHDVKDLEVVGNCQEYPEMTK